MSTQNNKKFLFGIVGMVFLATVAFTLMSTEDESVENQIEIEVSKEVDVEKELPAIIMLAGAYSAPWSTHADRR